MSVEFYPRLAQLWPREKPAARWHSFSSAGKRIPVAHAARNAPEQRSWSSVNPRTGCLPRLTKPLTASTAGAVLRGPTPWGRVRGRYCWGPAPVLPFGVVILIIDNYDSFTYNLVQRIGELGLKHPVKVVRNDAVTVDELEAWDPRHVIVSPGPCTPHEAGTSVELVKRFAGRRPLLGVCLGHQCIGQAFGAAIIRASRLMHGKTSPIHHVGSGIYAGLSNPFTATRYHSLTVDRKTLSDDFEVTSWTDLDELMGIRHKTMPIEGLQFHPESFLTKEGGSLLRNFLRQ